MKFQWGGGRAPCPPPPLAYAYAPINESKKGIRKFFARFLAFSNKILTVQNIVLSLSRGQGNFRGLEASRPRPRTSKCVLEAKNVLEDFHLCILHVTYLVYHRPSLVTVLHLFNTHILFLIPHSRRHSVVLVIVT